MKGGGRRGSAGWLAGWFEPIGSGQCRIMGWWKGKCWIHFTLAAAGTHVDVGWADSRPRTAPLLCHIEWLRLSLKVSENSDWLLWWCSPPRLRVPEVCPAGDHTCLPFLINTPPPVNSHIDTQIEWSLNCFCLSQLYNYLKNLFKEGRNWE